MNRSLFVKAALIFSMIACKTWGSGTFNQRHDVQFWEWQYFEYKISPKTSLHFISEFRWGNNGSELYLSYLQGTVSFAPKDWLTISPSYRHLSALRLTGERITIYEPFVDVIFKFKLGKWVVQDRNRVFDCLIFESLPDQWQYRNRLKLFSPWEWGKLKLNPFISDEIFIRERLGFSENRLAFGGRLKLAKAASSEFFYMLRNIKFPTWRPTHVFGLYFYLKY